MLISQRAGRRGRLRTELGSECAAVGQRTGGFASGYAPRGVGLQVGRLDPGGADLCVPVAVRDVKWRDRRSRSTPARNLSSHLPGRGRGVAHRPSTTTVRHRHQRSLGNRVGSKSAPTQNHLGTHGLGSPTLKGGSTSGRTAVGIHRRRQTVGLPRFEDRLPASAPAEVSVQGPGRPVSVRDPGVVRPGSQPGKTDHDARGAEPTLAPSGGTERLGPRRADLRVQTVEGGDCPSTDPAGRGYARDPGLAVDQHRAATALALRAAPVLDRPDADPVP